MADKDTIMKLVGQIPDLDKRGTVHGPSWDDAITIFDSILEDGADAAGIMVNQLGEIDDGADWKVRYVLHGIALYLSRDGKEKQRAEFCAALAAQLEKQKLASVKRFILQQLQTAGGAEVLDAVAAVLLDNQVQAEAASALLAIGGAVELFRKALPNAKGPARLSIVQALGVLKDTQSVEALRKASDDEDHTVAHVAQWALANIGDSGAVDIMTKAADRASGFDRIKAHRHCLLLADHLAAAGKKSEADKIYRHLTNSGTDPSEQYLRDLAKESLAG